MPRPKQSELFPPSTGFKPVGDNHPLLWVRELRVYRVLTPGDHNLLRRISLRPGLNVLWAKPGDRSLPVRLHTPGVSGHGTGKSTFCRFIRHILGEGSFGNEDQRQRLREVFPEGWIVAEVHLAGEPWLVCRPFKIGAHSYCYHGKAIDRLFHDDGQDKMSFEAYATELNRTVTEPLAVATFATNPTVIDWAHILQWLTRDQECRFASLADFRDPSSESLAPDMAFEDRHFLFRAVLQLIDTAEQSELETHKKLLARRQDAEKRIPLLRFRAQSAYERMQALVPGFRRDLSGSGFLAEAGREWLRMAGLDEEHLASAREPEALAKVRENLVIEQTSLNAAQGRLDECRNVADWIELQLKKQRGEATDETLDAFVRSRFTPERYCVQPLSAAIEWECPLVHGRTLPVEKTADPRAPTAEELQTHLRNEQSQLEKHRLLVAAAQVKVNRMRETLATHTTQFDRDRALLSDSAARHRSLADEASRARTDHEESETLAASLETLDKKLRTSQDRQTTLREQNHAALSAFSETFDRISRAMLGDDIKGSIRFKGRQIQPSFVHGIELTSAALETMKILCFDLAAMIAGVEGRGKHPRFLLHDGPREADMDAGLYQRIFILSQELEAAFGKGQPNFQYILTTTEPPPESVRNGPGLLNPVLSAISPDQKFLGEDF